MFCYKCGNELRDGAQFCDKCGAKQEKSKAGSYILGIGLAVIGILLLFVGIRVLTSMNKPSNYSVVSVYTDKQDDVKEQDKKVQDVTIKPQKETVKSSQETVNIPKDIKLELPSLVSYSKDRLSLGDYSEDKPSGGYVQYFIAGKDTSIVQCIAEYKDTVMEYDLKLTGTLSSAEDGFNYTCYLFTYSGTAKIKKDSINFHDSGVCDLCFVTAVKEGESYIAAYVPEGVSFEETSHRMKNGY